MVIAHLLILCEKHPLVLRFVSYRGRSRNGLRVLRSRSLNFVHFSVIVDAYAIADTAADSNTVMIRLIIFVAVDS